MIQLKCPFCSKSVNVDDSLAGAYATCSGCKSKFRVPQRSEAAVRLQERAPAAKKFTSPGAETTVAKPPLADWEEDLDDRSARRRRADDKDDLPSRRRRVGGADEGARRRRRAEDTDDLPARRRRADMEEETPRRKGKAGGMPYFLPICLSLTVFWFLLVGLSFVQWWLAFPNIVVGGLVSTVFTIWFLVLVFRRDTVQGLLCLFIAPYALFYAIVNFAHVGRQYVTAILGSFMMMSGVAVLLIAGIGTVAKKTFHEFPSTIGLPSTEQPLGEPEFKTSAEEFAKEFIADSKAAQQKYEGKIVEVEGTIAWSNKIISERGIFLKGAKKNPKDLVGVDIGCYPAKSQFDSVWRLGKGQSVRVLGRVSGAYLLECAITELSANPTPTVSADKLAADFAQDKAAATKKYVGEGDSQELIVQGTVSETAKSKDGNYTIRLLTPKGGLSVSCAVGEGDGKSVKAGDKVAIKGDVVFFFEDEKKIAVNMAFLLSKENGDETVPDKPDPTKPDPEPTTPSVTITAKDLAREFIAGEAATKYKNALIEVEGTVDNANHAPTGKFMLAGVYKPTSTERVDISCLGGKKKLADGMRVKVVGKFSATAQAIELQNCTVTELGKSDEPDKPEPGQPIIVGYKGSVGALAFSPDGKTLALARRDKTILLWDVATRKERASSSGHKEYINALAYSPDGKFLASGGGDGSTKKAGEILFWDPETGKSRGGGLVVERAVMSLTFSPDNKFLLSSEGGVLRAWDLMARPVGATKGSFNSFAMSPDSKVVAAPDDKVVKLWDFATGKESANLKGHEGRPNRVAFAADGKLASAQLFDGSIKIWDPAMGKELVNLEGSQDTVRALAFSPNSKVLAAASRHIKLWDVDSGKELAELQPNKFTYLVYDMAFSPDGKTLVTAHDSSTESIILWDLGTILK